MSQDVSKMDTWVDWQQTFTGQSPLPKCLFVAWDANRRCFILDWTIAGSIKDRELFTRCDQSRDSAAVARMLQMAHGLGWRLTWGGELP